MMACTHYLIELEQVATELTEAQRVIDELLARRRTVMLAALGAGCSKQSVADAANVHRSRLYQLLNAHPPSSAPKPP